MIEVPQFERERENNIGILYKKDYKIISISRASPYGPGLDPFSPVFFSPALASSTR